MSSVHTTSSYDPLGRQVSTTNPVSGTSITTYNATEQVAAQDAQGNVTRESYDAAGRLIQATDALTGTVGYGYAAAGNTTAITSGDTSGNVIQVETRQYDALNRAIADTVAGPNGASPQTTTTRYDPDGNTYQVNQPTGATTVDTYDLADDLVTSETDGAPVLSATHQNQSTYRYDAAGNGVETADPDGRDTTTTFDGDSRAVSEVSTTPGVTGTTTLTTTSQYDPDGNTLAQTVQTRDPSGNVQTFTNSATFDAADNQTSATDNGLTTAYGYDAAGQQRTETIQNGASTVTTTLDPQGRETALAEGGYTSSFSYNSNDLPLTATLPGGIQEARAYDPNSRLTGLTASGPTQVPATTTLHSAYAYGYDAAGRVNSTTTLSGTDALGYDAQGRLTQECGPQVVIKGGDGCYHYTYDADGNLLTALDDQVGVTDLYTYTNPLQPDQQTQGGATTSPATATIAFGYDGAGNTTSISDPVALADPSSAPYKKDARNDSFGYDALERVVRVTRLESTKVGTDTIVTPFTATIAYNAAGLRSDYLLTPDPRTGKQPVDTRFSYRGGELAQAVVVAVTGTLYTNTFVYRADGTPYELIRSDPTGTARYWYETDGMGSVVALTDVNGKVMDRYGYDSWGEPVIDDRVNEMVPQQLRYKGYYYDEALTYYWAGGRYYDPEAMRWLQPSSPNANDYAYAGDNPLGTGGAVARSGGPRPRTACFIITTVYFTSAVCTDQRNPIYMFLIGDDEATLGSDAGFFPKALAVVDLASNLTLIVPIEGEADRVAVKGAVLELERLAKTGPKGAYRYRLGQAVEPITRTIEHYTNRESYFYEVAKKYGINLRGVKIIFDSSIPPGRYGVTSEEEGGRVIRVGMDAFENEAQAANTIAHELNHARDLIGNDGKFRGTEEAARAVGNALQDYIEGGR